jgi:hypothetical protein
VNRATINMGVQLSYLYVDLHDFRYMPKSGMAVWYNRSVFNFLRHHHTDFHSAYTSLHSHQQLVWEGFFFPSLLTSIFWCLFSWRLPIWLGEMESQCHFDLHFLYS